MRELAQRSRAPRSGISGMAELPCGQMSALSGKQTSAWYAVGHAGECSQMIVSLVAFALVVAPLPSHASTPEAAATSFLDAFKSMDEDRFENFFAPDVTMFFPDGPFPTGVSKDGVRCCLPFTASSSW